MNSVSVVGKLGKVFSGTAEKSGILYANAKIAVKRPYKVGGEVKTDIFKIQAYGKVAERLIGQFPATIIGITGILETDPENHVYINVRSIFYYEKEEASQLRENTMPYAQIEAQSGFAAIADTDIPDF